MTLRAASLLLLIVAATPGMRYFRYDRPVLNTPQQAQQACVTLDPATFIHAGSDLASLRLYNGANITPYVINYVAPLPSSVKSITPLNLGLRNGSVSFDAVMPDGPYSNLDLAVDAHDFIATVRVTGSQTQSGLPLTTLGSYTIFDFTRQKLGRSTILHLPPSDFRYLHFRIDGPIHPGQITGLNTERLPASQPQYVTIAVTNRIQQQGRDTILKFVVPPNVPVDRILFTPGAQPANFSRDVTVTVAPAAASNREGAYQSFPVSTSGNLLRLHTTRNGHKIDEEHLAVEAPFQTFSPATTWTVAIHNQDDAPIALDSVSLQMIARDLCFDAAPNAAYTLYYGDGALSAPHYDYAVLFTLDKDAARASLGPEQPNPEYQPRPDTRPFTEKHPALLWIALIAAILILGLIALRSSKQLKQP